MSTYKLSEQGKRRIKIEMLRLLFFIALPLCLIALIPGLVLMYQHEQTIFSSEFIQSIVIFFGIIIIVFLFRGRSIIKSSQSLQITVKDNSIIQEQNGRQAKVIQASDLKHLVEIQGKGIEIRSSESSQSVFIPKDIENYEALKSEISSWIPQTAEQNTGNRNMFLKFVPVFLWAIMLTIYSLTGNKILGLAVAIVLIGLIIYTIANQVKTFLDRRK